MFFLNAVRGTPLLINASRLLGSIDKALSKYGITSLHLAKFLFCWLVLGGYWNFWLKPYQKMQPLRCT